MRAIVFVADDEQVIRAAIVKRLIRQGHFAVGYESGEALLQGLEQKLPELVFLDLKMPGISGLDTLKQVRQLAPSAIVIMLTAYGTVPNAVEAMKLGAYDFLIKTVDLEGVDAVTTRAIEMLTLRRRLESEVGDQANQFHLNNLEAYSPVMKQLLEQVRGVAENPKSSVMLLGETGTGKEFLARVIHHNGPRASGPFVGVNCTAIPKDLFESELFGYERGAFTGANQRKLGLLEKAEGGTLFLDEIGDLDLSMQAKLLRVIQERSFRRLGSNDDLGVDFRLVTATNREIKKDVERGLFREDLYFRLNVVMFEIPPLRKRVEDILPLCQRTIMRFAKEFGKPVPEMDPEARSILQEYQYPGNIRELENILERAMIFCSSQTLAANYLPRELRDPVKKVATAVSIGEEQLIRIEMHVGKQTLEQIEESIIEETLRLADYNKSLAAKQLGLTRFSLDRRLKKHN
ncbi:MAG: Fis family transcriptional regulator [Nitrospira sp. UW-LDO-01]|jgi:two-component system response regulator AtoC|nr:sigma-54-dependent Fis family transcriptional regulator [Nitrospira sp.]MBL8053215.1 sigma-54-dependent Fis family transcriptional regulator [Nitrospira sp.]OYT20756.1 MAG: Fis family transcriptional regulator [Nitrospira sp. UW-LDO-01]